MFDSGYYAFVGTLKVMGECREMSELCIALFCVMTPCRGLVGDSRRFGGILNL